MAVSEHSETTAAQAGATTTNERIGAKSGRLGGTGLFAAGGLLGALAASSCCIVPLVLFGLGVSGAWIGNLTALAPYQPIFVVLTLGFLGTGFYLVYRKPKAAACVEEPSCARPASGRTVKLVLWSATVLIAAALAFPYVTPLFLGV